MRERFQAIKAALIVSVAAISFYAFVFAAPHLSAALKSPDTINNWSNAKLRTQLGEAQQVMDCTQLGLPAGLTCRVYVNQPKLRVVIVATQ